MDGILTDSADRLETLAETMPDIVVSLVVLVFALVAALLVHELLHRILTRLAARREQFWHSLVDRAANPMRLSLIAGAFALAAPLAPLSEPQAYILHHLLLIGFIAILMRVAQLALHIFISLHLRQFELGTRDNLLARKHITQTRILQRIAGMLIVVVGLGAMLMTFDTVRQYGISLLASAGAAGIVVGLALQPMMKNLFAGIQLAITQPIRIDDALIVEGEWGNVEEITSTYVVIRIWDRRRLIVPLNYFIEKPFQNWTHQEAALTGVVTLYVDFSVPVSVVREKAQEIVHTSPLWDGEVFGLQVTDLRERTMELRIVAGAANSGDAWNLRCLVREEIVTFLAKEYPHALPRFRAEFEGTGMDAGPVDENPNGGPS